MAKKNTATQIYVNLKPFFLFTRFKTPGVFLTCNPAGRCPCGFGSPSLAAFQLQSIGTTGASHIGDTKLCDANDLCLDPYWMGQMSKDVIIEDDVMYIFIFKNIYIYIYI